MWNYYNPVHVEFGTIESIGSNIQGKNILLVTSQGFLKRGMVARIKDILSNKNVIVWSEAKPNPDWSDLHLIREKLVNTDIDFVIALGGGSVIDAAKVLALTIKNPAKDILKSYFNGQISCIEAKYKLPLIAVPTTSGTGSEVTPFATVWDHEKHKKHSLAGDYVYPDFALIDSSLTTSLSREVTIYPGLDAISHALESIWNKKANPISRGFAINSLELSIKALPIVLAEPDNLEFRAMMQTASVLAGLAISQTKTAIAHSISYPLTTRYGVPHGLACSFTLPKLIEWTKYSLMEAGINENLLIKTHSTLIDFKLNDLIKQYLSLEQALELKDSMINKERSENFAYELPYDLCELISVSMNAKN